MKLSISSSYTNWFVADEVVPDDLTQEQWQWLINPHSLTQNFRQLTHNQIEHFLESEKAGFAYPEERAILKLSHNTIWQRQILWKLQGQVWVYGRVVIPDHTASAFIKELKQLGSQSLGDFLFSHFNLIRQPIEVCRVGSNHPYYQQAKPFHSSSVNYFWSRRSIFTIDQQDILVVEIFLPTFFTFISNMFINNKKSS